MKKVEDFQATSSKTAGMSPSEKVILKTGNSDIRYQLKLSNHSRSTRRIVGYDPDVSDILGEFIASTIASRILNKPGLPERSPEVVLVEDTRTIRIASRYLNDKELGSKEVAPRYLGMTLDELMHKRNQKNGWTNNDKGHAIITNDGGVSPRNLNIDSEFKIDAQVHGEIQEVNVKLDKRELYEVLKLSMLLSDHDINPGNLYMVYDTESRESHIGRIDYGHAFNDLIKNWQPHHKVLGDYMHPGVKDELGNKGFVLDALNRKGLNGVKATKFRRDYRGIMLDEDFANVLRQGLNFTELEEAIDQAKGEIVMLLESDNMDIAKQCKDSLIAINHKLGLSKQLDNGQLVESTMESIKTFIVNNQREMESVANLIEVQNKIDKALLGEYSSAQAANDINKIVSSDKHYLAMGIKGHKIEWLRAEGEPELFIGTLEEYITHKGKSLGIDPKPISQEINESVEYTVHEKADKLANLMYKHSKSLSNLEKAAEEQHLEGFITQMVKDAGFKIDSDAYKKEFFDNLKDLGQEINNRKSELSILSKMKQVVLSIFGGKIKEVEAIEKSIAFKLNEILPQKEMHSKEGRPSFVEALQKDRELTSPQGIQKT